MGGVVLFEEGFKTGGNAFFLRDAGDAFGEVHDAATFFQSELSQEEEGLARSGSYPVRVTASGIQHRAGSFLQAFIGHIDQLVFQLEWADGLHFLFKILSIHIVKFKFVSYKFFGCGKLILRLQETNLCVARNYSYYNYYCFLQ